MSEASLTAAFLARVKQPEAWQGQAALPTVLADLFARGQQSWPALLVAPERFAAHLADCVSAEEGSGRELGAVNAADLYLACACAQDVPGAVLAFERSILPHLPTFLARLRPTPDQVQEVGQLLREHLFLSKGGAPPKISSYAGRGPLLGWVRVVALRIALRSRQSDKGRSVGSDQALIDALPDGDSPERLYIQGAYRKEFEDCFRQALTLLGREQRTLLRMHFLEGLSGPQLAALFQVNRSTATRRLQEARTALLDHTQRLLRQRLKLSESQFHSLAGIVLSQLDISIVKYLQE